MTPTSELTRWAVDLTHNHGKSIIEILPLEDKDGKIVPFEERVVTKALAGERVVADYLNVKW